jgi:serine/threonine protein phosphatase 1
MLRSYGVDQRQLAEAFNTPGLARQLLLALLPAEHLAFLRGLELCHQEGDYFFVHAGVRPGVPLDAQRREDIIWIRGSFLHSDSDHGKVIVHGHSISSAPQRRANRIGIDTGAFQTGVLSCLVLHGDSQKILNTEPA